MTSIALWFEAWAACFDAWLAAVPRHPPATVTDIREGHVIRARPARQREDRL